VRAPQPHLRSPAQSLAGEGGRGGRPGRGTQAATTSGDGGTSNNPPAQEWLRQRKPKSYSSLDEALANVARTYRRNLWDYQDVYVEVWTEKDALAGVLYEETAKWDVPLMVSRGFASESYLFEAAGAITEQDKPAYLYYFGDHDPSGVQIDRSIRAGLERLAPYAEIHFERVAVLPGQIAELGLPTRPTKKSDSRSKNFKGESVEVDAIEPARLRLMVRECIEQHLDRQALEALKLTERKERETLIEVAQRFKPSA
jgi:hypothetical protein